MKRVLLAISALSALVLGTIASANALEVPGAVYVTGIAINTTVMGSAEL